MSNLTVVETKVFLPAKDFELSQNFYQDLGFEICSAEHGVAYVKCSETQAFLLQDYYQEDWANNFMMHLLVEDAQAWHDTLSKKKLVETYGVKMSEVTEQPWKMLDFTLTDPSGVLWRIAQNI